MTDPIANLIAAAANLLAYVERNECYHETTHRGGIIWTICDDCGAKWADDRGGFEPYQEPAEITAARDAIAAAKAAAEARPDGDIIEMRRCEIPNLTLHAGPLYRFSDAPGCVKCAAYGGDAEARAKLNAEARPEPKHTQAKCPNVGAPILYGTSWKCAECGATGSVVNGKAARPEPAAEPSRIDLPESAFDALLQEAVNSSRHDAGKAVRMLSLAVEALAREVRRG